jgi:phosphate transport system substrate-binding protein
MHHLLSFVLLSLVVSSAGLAADTVVVRCSQTVTPILESAKTLVAKDYPNTVFTITGCGTKGSIEAVAYGTAKLGATVRPLRPEEQEANPDLILTEIAKDGMALVVRDSNPVRDLTSEQFAGILLGTVTNWNQLGGPDLPIAPIGRSDVNQVVEFVNMKLGLEHRMVTGPRSQSITYKPKGAATFGQFLLPAVTMNTEVLAQVAKNPGGFTFITLGLVRERIAKGEHFAILSFNGIAPTEAAVRDGTYPFARSLFLLTKGAPTGPVKALVEAVLSPEGQQIIVDQGFVLLQ